jgi:hypothetical protein
MLGRLRQAWYLIDLWCALSGREGPGEEDSGAGANVQLEAGGEIERG